MTEPSANDSWAEGNAYEAFMGRWSRLVAREFIKWLRPKDNASWLDIGCGTGALTSAICAMTQPATVVGCDQSATFIEHANRFVDYPQANFRVADLSTMPKINDGFDYVVSGLVLNFLPDPIRAIKTQAESARREGVIAAYVWDYSTGMEFLRIFWDEAVALSPDAHMLHEGSRFPICDPDRLRAVFFEAGLQGVEVDPIDFPTRFESFADYWKPLLGGTGPAPGYVASLSADKRNELYSRLNRRLTGGAEVAINLTSRAWAIRGQVAL